ncbi:hypothetical protein [Methylophilus sp. OH31]|uniref:hypothetical protein n=1 Tax=Methylophilus sp. OH31 TaxID=1387312 RepID=UPI000464B8C1|nr:hypothetical protein [Methylophilus sp. OH31]
MGIFSGIKNTYKKSEAAVVVQNLLEHQARAGLFDQDPAATATQMIECAWKEFPDIFNGKFGQRPHKISVAAFAFANLIVRFNDNEITNVRAAVIFSLGNILSELEVNSRLYPLNSLDHYLIENSTDVYLKSTEGL